MITIWNKCKKIMAFILHSFIIAIFMYINLTFWRIQKVIIYSHVERKIIELNSHPQMSRMSRRVDDLPPYRYVIYSLALFAVLAFFALKVWINQRPLLTLSRFQIAGSNGSGLMFRDFFTYRHNCLFAIYPELAFTSQLTCLCYWPVSCRQYFICHYYHSLTIGPPILNRTNCM